MITKICVTGGIGSGKSVICRICALKGLPIYDCDSQAKSLMQSDPQLRAFLIDLIGTDAFEQDGKLNRKLLANKIFSNDKLRTEVEREVHAAVRRDITEWLDRLEELNTLNPASPVKAVIIETAIPQKSFIDKMADLIWVVDADTETRIERVKTRSELTREQILSRMASQNREFRNLPADKTSYIYNSDNDALLPQLHRLLAHLI